MSSTRPNLKNINVSGSVLSCEERCELAKIIVKFEKQCHGNYKAPVWHYFGERWYLCRQQQRLLLDSLQQHQALAWTTIIAIVCSVFSMSRRCTVQLRKVTSAGLEDTVEPLQQVFLCISLNN